MCGRYGFIPGSKDQFKKRFNVERVDFDINPHYNVAPGQTMPVVTHHSPNTVEEMKWGLVPFWAKDPKIGYQMINARAETVATKPSFRRSFTKQRCLVPASGFFEWKKLDGSKQPFYIRLKHAPLFSFAGLYDIWKDAEGRELKTYTIITTEPNSLLAPIHNRMPVILTEAGEITWLNEAPSPLKHVKLLRPFSAENMESFSVSKKVNNPENDTEDILTPEEQQTII